tara:strand:- start:395 stop:1024 length:630 start_codon:yes stop_codon:yes gene_type:complete
MSRTVLVWIDLETTGLDTKNGRILEYAMVLTDTELNELGAVECIIPQSTAEARDLMDDYVTDMHEGNGLLEALEKVERELPVPAYGDSVKVADDILTEKLAKLPGEGNTFTIAGSTVGFDKSFIKKDMPKLFRALHYRQLDVSSYKVGFPTVFPPDTSDAHRAMPDIRASIEIHRKMCEIVEHGHSHIKTCDDMFTSQKKPTFDEHDCC